MTDTPALGPVALCTLIAQDGQALVEAYCSALHQQAEQAHSLDEGTAWALGRPQLAGNPAWLLSNARGRQWLHIVEYTEARPRKALHTLGWMAMEVLVENADELADQLALSAFELLRPPADLDVSDRIRAFQARGPAGEILYLTQVKGPVPPFDLPTCRAPVDHLFIPVLSTPSRDASLQDYSAISGNQGLTFDTRITVVNQAREQDLEQRHPVATLQLAGQSLIEMDEIAGSEDTGNGITAGMACVTFHCSGPPGEEARLLASGPFAGHPVSACTGTAGERFALIHP